MKRWSGLGKAALVLLILGLALPAASIGYGISLRPHVIVLGSSSMAPTYHAGQRVTTYAVDPGEVRRGDVVLFTAAMEPGGPPEKTLSRVVALGGDHVSQCGDRPVQLNGAPLDEPYLQGGAPNGGDCFDTTVPTGEMFVMGDHRAAAYDSRYRGTFPVASVISRTQGSTAALATVGLLFLLGVLLLPVALVLSLIARRRRRTAPPEALAYPAWVLAATPPAAPQPAAEQPAAPTSLDKAP